jgi:hypothetical protein
VYLFQLPKLATLYGVNFVLVKAGTQILGKKMGEMVYGMDTTAAGTDVWAPGRNYWDALSDDIPYLSKTIEEYKLESNKVHMFATSNGVHAICPFLTNASLNSKVSGFGLNGHNCGPYNGSPYETYEFQLSPNQKVVSLSPRNDPFNNEIGQELFTEKLTTQMSCNESTTSKHVRDEIELQSDTFSGVHCNSNITTYTGCSDGTTVVQVWRQCPGTPTTSWPVGTVASIGVPVDHIQAYPLVTSDISLDDLLSGLYTTDMARFFMQSMYPTVDPSWLDGI